MKSQFGQENHYFIDKNTGRIVQANGGVLEGGRYEIRYRVRGGKNPLDIVLGFIFKIFDPIIKPIRGIVDAIVLLIKAIVYAIMIFIWAIKVFIWFFVELIPSIPGDIWLLVKFVTYAIFDTVFGTIRLLAKRTMNKAGMLTLDAVSQGWDNVPDPNEPQDEEAGFYSDYIACSGKKCYVTEDGTIPAPVVMATVLFPPLGVFMEYGATGWLQILITLLLTLAFYIPGLLYALVLLYC
jgi:uncharacterized membrane protein YqaE (UPF0057 family)